MMLVAFDVDGTLIDYDDQPREEIIALLKRHHARGDAVMVWSGGGLAYAQNRVDRLGLTPYVSAVVTKASLVPDVTYDDQVVRLGRKNFCVGTGDHEERW
jgi:phosphoserine phosphatase